jgi:hypothetical protein
MMTITIPNCALKDAFDKLYGLRESDSDEALQDKARADLNRAFRANDCKCVQEVIDGGLITQCRKDLAAQGKHLSEAQIAEEFAQEIALECSVAQVLSKMEREGYIKRLDKPCDLA